MVRDSDRNSVAEDPLSEARAKAVFADHVNAAPKEVLQIHHQPPQVEQAPSGSHSHDEVDITRVARLPARDGAEYPNIGRAVLRRETEHIGSVSVESGSGGHMANIRPARALGHESLEEVPPELAPSSILHTV